MKKNYSWGIFIYVIIFIAFTFVNCSSQQQRTRLKNVASTYNPSKTSIHPVFRVYHISDSISR
ncbi:MAG: hypothetical protein U9R19_08175, partial [Bacteroidota bacterium]|nr:hypothetical protein [Bacteroidota bacterium]